MIVMIFEYQLNEAHRDAYMQQSGILRHLVKEIDGFISIERFQSASDPGKVLALGYFRDEEAVRVWRNLPEHRQAQLLGREAFFSDYHLVMAEVSRDYSRYNREQVPDDSRQFHDKHHEIGATDHV